MAQDDDQTFLARKLGEMQADLAKIAAMIPLTPTDAERIARGSRPLVYVIIGLLVLILLALLLHAAYSAGWLGG